MIIFHYKLFKQIFNVEWSFSEHPNIEEINDDIGQEINRDSKDS